MNALQRRIERLEEVMKPERVVELQISWARNEAEANAAANTPLLRLEPGVRCKLCWVD